MDRRNLLAVAAVAALFLFTFVSVRLPLDQDLGSKAAKIESLARSAPFASPVNPPYYYRESYFPFYYQVQAVFHKVLPGSAVASTGYSAAGCGVIYLIGLAVFLQRMAGIGAWWTLFLFLNTPALVVNFLYGNEASLSTALLVAAAAILCLRRGVIYDTAAGLVLGLAFWCRPDIVLMGPFIVVLLVMDGEWRRLWATGLSGLATVVLYWLLFVRAIPNEAAFPWIIDWRIFAVYLVFGFGPVVFAMAVFGFFKARKRQWWLPLSTIVPLFYYFRDLGSPKYILGLALGTTLCAAWLIAASGRMLKTVFVVVALVFWFVSITPFGVFGPRRGGHWVAPAGHGPVAFGSYLSFYAHIRDGFFGARYAALERTWEFVLRSHALDTRPMRLIGSSDDHMLNLICEQHGIARASIPLTIDLPGDYMDRPARFVMLFNGYTRLSYLTGPGAEARVREWLAEGQVAPLAGDDSHSALPAIVEVGPTVTNGSKELGQRILFADSYAKSSGLAPLQYFTGDYDAFCFVPAGSAAGAVIFRDSSFAATTQCPKDAEVWGNWWPSVYYRQHADRAREALAGGKR